MSIGAVLVSHTFFLHHQTHDARWLRLIASLGPLGVSIFFGISGFIITSLLARERRRDGRIDLRAFYIRRAFRILPPFWVYLLVIILAGPPFQWAQYRNAFLFVTDYLPSNWWAGHSWSLSVEEQFYLLWPITVVLAWARLRAVAVALIIASPVLRVITHLAYPTLSLDAMFHTRIDALMVGCLIALTRDDWDRWPLRSLADGRLALLAATHLVVFSPLLLECFAGKYLYPIGTSSEAMAVGVIILWAIRNPAGPVGRALNSRPVRHVGLISYSLYLWQQPFFSRELASVWIGRFPANILAALALAELSYWLVEQPCLRLRDKVLRRWRRIEPLPQAMPMS